MDLWFHVFGNGNEKLSEKYKNFFEEDALSTTRMFFYTGKAAQPWNPEVLERTE